jgi:hypothetical protein
MFELPSAEQRRFLDLVADVYLDHAEWPVWAWMEEMLDRDGLDAEEIAASLPREPTVGYGLVFPNRNTVHTPQDRVGLTIAGLAHVPQAAALVTIFLNFVDALGSARASAHLDPFSESRPTITREALRHIRFPAPNHERFVVPLLSQEPSTWHCIVSPRSELWESIELSPAVRRFAGVGSVDDYLDRLSAFLGPRQRDTAGQFHSPFTLPAAADYLDVVWQLRFRERLITPPGVERSARLATDVSTADEVDSCLSALAELLKGMHVPSTPGVGGHPLQRLGPFLRDVLPAEAHARVERAVTILDAARTIRAGAQHSGARSRSVDAYALLGLRYPVSEWAAAWQQIQVACAEAFDSIRDELQAAPDVSSSGYVEHQPGR